MSRRYDDIIRCSRPVSLRHPPMPIAARAAQFLPFAALSGYEEAIQEAARQTDPRPVVDASAQAVLSEKLRLLAEAAPDRPAATFTYFVPDTQKAGGAYTSLTGIVKQVDPLGQAVIMADGSRIPFDFIREIESPLFPD